MYLYTKPFIFTFLPVHTPDHKYVKAKKTLFFIVFTNIAFVKIIHSICGRLN